MFERSTGIAVSIEERSTNMASVFKRVQKIATHQLGVEEDKVVPTASFVDDLNADSLDLVELIRGMEEEFGSDLKRLGQEFEIPDEDAEKIVTVGDAIEYLKDKGDED